MGQYEQGFAAGVMYGCTELKLLSRRRHLPLAIMLEAASNMGRDAALSDPEILAMLHRAGVHDG